MSVDVEVADIAIECADIDIVIGFVGWKKKMDYNYCFVFVVAVAVVNIVTVVIVVNVVVEIETGVVRLCAGYYLLDQYQMSQVNLHHY